MKTRIAQIVFALVLTTIVTVTLARAQLPAHLATGLDLVDQITAAQSLGAIYKPNSSPLVPYNRYGGSWGSTTNASGYTLANLDNGVYAENNTTCAPLVTHLLKNVHGWSWSKIAFIDPITLQSTTTASPTPYRYVALMKQKKGFPDGAVTNLAAVRPGYLFALWQPGLAQQDHDHAGIVVSIGTQGVPYPAHPNADPSLAGTTLFPVTILDSTSSPHGAGDTRSFSYQGTSYSLPGVGTAVMGALVNAQGAIVGHTWSMPPADPADVVTWLAQFSSRFHPQAERELVFARHEKQPAT